MMGGGGGNPHSKKLLFIYQAVSKQPHISYFSIQFNNKFALITTIIPVPNQVTLFTSEDDGNPSVNNSQCK